MLELYLRLLGASSLSFLVYFGIAVDLALPLVRLLAYGFGMSQKRFNQLTAAVVGPVLELVAATAFVLAFLWLQPPFSDPEEVLLALAVSYLGTWAVVMVLSQVRRGDPPAGPLRASGITVAALLLLLHIWPLVRLAMVVMAFYNALRTILDSDRFLARLQAKAEEMLKRLQRLQSRPADILGLRWTSGTVPLVILAVAYRLLEIPDLLGFLEFALYLWVAYALMQWAFVGIRQPEAAQLRWINPFAIAATFVILFTFYVALLQGHGQHPALYLANVAIFLTLLWYVSFLSRREVTIEKGWFATGSVDRDFQMDGAELTIGWFFGSLVRLQPLFLAAALHGWAPEASRRLGSPMVVSWSGALVVSLLLLLLATLAFLAIWARNIAAPELVREQDEGHAEALAGTDGRDPYPVYRQQLAASALPCCVFVPAMVFGLLAMLGIPLRFAGLSGLWLDFLFYGLLALALFGLFVQLPYRAGQTVWQRSAYRRHRNLEKAIELRIRTLHSTPTRQPSDALHILAGELTLVRLKEVGKRQKDDLNYRLRLFGEGISGSDAVHFLRGLVATALAAAAGVLTNLLLSVPEG